VWTRTYGGAGYDHAQSVIQTTDGGYMVAGYATSVGAGNHDVWLIKLNASGDSLWSRTFGGIWSDYAYDIEQTTDGGYIVAGAASSLGSGTMDVWIIKTNANGDSLWSRSFGGGGVNDYGECVKQTADGGYIIAGYTDSFSSSIDLYLIRLNASGNTIWTQTYGGGDNDQGYSVQQIADGGYIVAGQTMSYGAGNMDYWLIRLEAEEPPPPITLTLTPHTLPIYIPAGGGSFMYDVEVENNSASAYTIDIGIDVTLPSGSHGDPGQLDAVRPCRDSYWNLQLQRLRLRSYQLGGFGG
jgi:hypothetical protein